MKGVSDDTGDIVRERLGWDGVGYELVVFGLRVRVVWVGVDKSEGSWAGNAHSEREEGLRVVLVGVSRSEGSCAGSAHREVGDCLGVIERSGGSWAGVARVGVGGCGCR